MLALRHDPEVRVVILTGAGEKAFVAGADISELAAVDPARPGATWPCAGSTCSTWSSTWASLSSPPSTGSRSAAAASWRWRARSGSPPTPPGSGSRKSTSA